MKEKFTLRAGNGEYVTCRFDGRNNVPMLTRGNDNAYTFTREETEHFKAHFERALSVSLDVEAFIPTCARCGETGHYREDCIPRAMQAKLRLIESRKNERKGN